MFANQALHCVATEASTGAGREQRLVRLPGAFGQPNPEHGLGGRGQRNGAVFAAFAEAAEVRAGAEADVAAVQVDQLGQA